MQNVRKLAYLFLACWLACSSASSLEATSEKIPASVFLDTELKRLEGELLALEEAYNQQLQAYAQVFQNYEQSLKDREEQIETLSKRYVISKNVTIVVSTALMATILACIIQGNN